MNTCALMGRLTDDPEIRKTQEGKPIARYTLAVDRRGKDKGADFIRCTAFDNAADFAERYLHKGTKVAITGTIHTGSYTDRDGKTVYTTEVYAREHYFCESKGAGGAINRPNNFGGTNTYSTAPDGFADVPADAGVPFR